MKYLDFILGLFSMLIIAFIFSKVKGWLTNKVKDKLITNSSIGNIYTKEGKEVFQGKKFFKGLFNIFDRTIWAKSITIFSRYFIIGLIVFGAVYGYGWWKGRGETPVEVQLGHLQKESWELSIPKNASRVDHPADSNTLYWIYKNGKRVPITVKDMPKLNEILKPYGIIFDPYVTGGVGIGDSGTGIEGGVGAHWIRYYKWRLNTTLTQMGIYAGAGYKLNDLGLNNTSLNVSYGKGWSGDSRFLLHVAVEF